MADELRVSITADASGVGPAVAQATAAVESSADQIAAAQAKATAATKALTAAQVQLGAAAEGGSAAAAAIIAEYAAASSAATAAVEQLTAAEASNTTATLSNAAAQRVDTAATYSHSEAMGAAKVSMGAMTGSTHMMEMGLAKLAAGSSVLGPVLAAMVPVAVFAAGVFLLYDLGEALYKAFDMSGEAAMEAQKKTADLDESYKTLIDDTTLETDKIGAAIAKIEQTPNPNAMKEAIDEAMVEADKMARTLDGLIEREETLLKSPGMSDSGFKRFVMNEPSSRQEEVDLNQHEIHLENAKNLEEQLAESKSFVATEQTKLNDLTEKAVALDTLRNTNEYLSLGMTIVGVSNLDKEVQRLQLIVAEHKKETAAIQEKIEGQKQSADLAYVTVTKQIEQEEKAGTITHANAQQQISDAERVRAATLSAMGSEVSAPPALPPIKEAASDNYPEQIAKAQIDAAHAADAELAPQQEIVAAMDKQIELNNLKARFSKEGTAAERETLRLMENQIALSQAKEKIDALGREQLNRTFEEEQKAQAEAQRHQQEQARAALEESNRARAEQVSAARETAAATIEAANQEFERTQIEIRGQEELGLISHRVAQQRLLDALKLRETTTQGALKTEQGLFNPVTGEKEATEYKKLEDQMTKEAQRAALERERIVQQEATKMEQVYKRVANEFNTDFTRAFNEWATKSQTAGQAFGHMLGDMELQVADFAAKWILQKVEMWAMSKLLDATGYATQFAIQKSANVAAVTSDAGVAAAGAMAYYSAINPPAAPAMAALQFAETMSYAVMDSGGMMPHMGFAFNKSGSAERVLSPSQTSNFESLVNNGGSRTAHLHQTNNYGGAPTKEMHEAQTAHTISRLKSMLRPEAFA
jgi:hypothetical protein